MAAGKECVCAARSENECVCDSVDWRSQELIDLQAENASLKAAIVARDAEVRRKAYEECAVLCEGLDMYDEDDPGASYSSAIRRMAKEKIST